ncbi:hypothetical protein Tco_1087613 [Tanacetum coccineum]
MSDSSSGVTSDLNDMDDIEMIMQQLQSEQELEQAAESSNRRKYINRERLEAEEHLRADYFGAHPKYPDYYFRRRYRMSRKLFLEIAAGIENYFQTHHPLPPHFDFFRVRNRVRATHVSAWDDKPYQVLPGGEISYYDERDVVSFLDLPKELVPLVPTSYNPAAYLAWSSELYLVLLSGARRSVRDTIL